jgi:hypothetical protein
MLPPAQATDARAELRSQSTDCATCAVLCCDCVCRYNSDGRAKEIRNAIPRIYGPKMEMPAALDWSVDPDDTSQGWIGYGIGTVAFGGVGIFFMLFVFFGCPCFCFWRYCCNCCCHCRDPRKEGYSVKEKWSVYIALAILALGGVTFGISGWVFSEQLHNAMLSDDAAKPGISRMVPHVPSRIPSHD